MVAEHAAIYGYGLVSAHVMPDENDLVSEALAPAPRAPRGRADADERPVGEGAAAGPGYQLPLVVNNANNAARLAVRMESDCAVAWRAVLEQTDSRRTASSP